MARHDTPSTLAGELGDTVSREASLWPDTGRMRRAGNTSVFEASRFDPLYEQKSRERWRLSTQFDLCRPALALRVLLFLQIAVGLAAARSGKLYRLAFFPDLEQAWAAARTDSE